MNKTLILPDGEVLGVNASRHIDYLDEEIKSERAKVAELEEQNKRMRGVLENILGFGTCGRSFESQMAIDDAKQALSTDDVK